MYLIMRYLLRRVNAREYASLEDNNLGIVSEFFDGFNEVWEIEGKRNCDRF